MRPNTTLLTLLLSVASLLATVLAAAAQDLFPYYYDIGQPQLQEIFVDPLAGSDERSGTTRASALRTVREAWRRIPSSETLSTGYRINLLPGTYGDDEDETPSYWELKRGTFTAPIIVRAADGQDTVTLTTDINMANVSYFYLINVTIKRAGDTFHCEGCDHILLRGNSLIGAPRGRTVGTVAHETVKFNQSQHVYIESNAISGADDNAIDWVAVQYGHIVANTISDAQGWCAYVKGGSAYVRIEGNEFANCFEGGVTAGQGTGIEYMTGPWFRHEAYDVKIINNVIHDISGAALGVNGGYNILLAHNTAYRVGSRSHLVEIVFGARSCDESAPACLSRVNAGAWGPSTGGDDVGQPIGNRNVKVLNNLLYNPAGYAVGDQHFAIHGPQIPTAVGIPAPQRSDVGLEIKGNLIWSGASDHPLGIEDASQGCRPANLSCNQAQLVAENSINTVEPALAAPASGDFRPQTGSAILGLAPAALTAFFPRDESESTPEGVLANAFSRDRSGSEASVLVPGAYASAGGSLSPPSNPGSSNPGLPGNLFISSLRARSLWTGARHRVSVSFVATSSATIVSATARLSNGKRISLRRRGSRFSGQVELLKAGRLSVTVSAQDRAGESARRSVEVRR